MPTRIAASCILLAVSGFVLTGCSGKDMGEAAFERMMEQGIEQETGGSARVDIGEESMHIETNEGTMTMGGELPSNWPSDVPVYQGATVNLAGSTTPEGGDPGMMLMYSVPDAPAIVAKFYESGLAANGWKSKSTIKTEDITIWEMTKDDRTLSVTVSAEDGGTSVAIGIEQKR